MANTFFYNDQVMDWMKENLKKETPLNLAYVDYGDIDDLIPEYPAVIITGGAKDRTVHATHMFQVSFEIDLWVLHANLNVGYAQRKKEDIQLCGKIQDFLDKNFTLPTDENFDNIIFGYIQSENPGILNRKGTPIVSTRMRWSGISHQPFN